eukprot:3888322-Rhodomonas_salina.1
MASVLPRTGTFKLSLSGALCFKAGSTFAVTFHSPASDAPRLFRASPLQRPRDGSHVATPTCHSRA